MKADMRNKKFAFNVHKENYFNVLKTVGVYGPNNAGKTCLIKCIKAMKNGKDKWIEEINAKIEQDWTEQ